MAQVSDLRPSLLAASRQALQKLSSNLLIPLSRKWTAWQRKTLLLSSGFGELVVVLPAVSPAVARLKPVLHAATG